MLSVGNIQGTNKEILLEEKERIFGVTGISRAPNGHPAVIGDLQFMIYKID
jgi:hypothetical protein